MSSVVCRWMSVLRIAPSKSVAVKADATDTFIGRSSLYRIVVSISLAILEGSILVAGANDLGMPLNVKLSLDCLPADLSPSLPRELSRRTDAWTLALGPMSLSLTCLSFSAVTFTRVGPSASSLYAGRLVSGEVRTEILCSVVLLRCLLFFCLSVSLSVRLTTSTPYTLLCSLPFSIHSLILFHLFTYLSLIDQWSFYCFTRVISTYAWG